MDLENVRPILEFVALIARYMRQLAGLTDGNKSGSQSLGNRTAKNEATTLDRDDVRDVGAAKRIGHRTRRRGEPIRVCKQRGDVFEHDPPFWIVRDVAYQLLDAPLQRVARLRNGHAYYLTIEKGWS